MEHTDHYDLEYTRSCILQLLDEQSEKPLDERVQTIVGNYLGNVLVILRVHVTVITEPRTYDYPGSITTHWHATSGLFDQGSGDQPIQADHLRLLAEVWWNDIDDYVESQCVRPL